MLDGNVDKQSICWLDKEKLSTNTIPPLVRLHQQQISAGH